MRLEYLMKVTVSKESIVLIWNETKNTVTCMYMVKDVNKKATLYIDEVSYFQFWMFVRTRFFQKSHTYFYMF